MERFIARFFSAFFHPLLIPTISVFILFNINSYIAFSVPGTVRRFTLILVFLNTAIAPVILILLLKKLGVIKSYFLDERADRAYPILLAGMLFYLTLFVLRQLNLPVLFYYFMGGATILIMFCFFVSLFWKISIHMASMGGMTGAVIATSMVLQLNIQYLVAACILASGMLAFSRLKLNAHNPGQVYAGYIAGVVIMLLMVLRPF